MNNRQTRQKEAILSVIRGVGVHLSAEEIYDQVQQKEPGIGLATVYRNLKTLCDQQMIQKVTVDGYSFYDGCSDPHDHFICDLCGKISDIPCFEHRKLDEFITKQVPGKVTRRISVYFGICEDCLRERDWRITS